jgi:hypothetical protein
MLGMKNRMTAVCALAAVLAISCATVRPGQPGGQGARPAEGLPGNAPAPDWVYAPAAEYPDTAFLTAVGYAATREGAESAAIGGIGKTLRQTIQAETSAQEAFAQNDGTWTSGLAYTGTVSTSTALDNISGVTIKEVWGDGKGTIYALAALNRNESGRYYQGLIEKNAQVINSQIAYAAGNAESFEALGALNRAVKLAEENAEHLHILSAVNPGMYSLVSLEYGGAVQVKELAQRYLGRIPIAIAVTGDQDNLVGGAFAEGITAAGLSPLFTQTGVYTYVLKVAVHLEDAGLLGNYQTVRYTVDASLTDVRNGKTLLPLTISGRESHTSQQEAQNRAFRTIRSEVSKTFAPRFAALLKSY